MDFTLELDTDSGLAVCISEQGRGQEGSGGSTDLFFAAIYAHADDRSQHLGVRVLAAQACGEVRCIFECLDELLCDGDALLDAVFVADVSDRACQRAADVQGDAVMGLGGVERIEFGVEALVQLV